MVNIICDSSADLINPHVDLNMKIVNFYIFNKSDEGKRELDANKNIDKNISVSSSCPAPYDFLNEIEQGLDSYIITMSSKVSGSYNSALIAKEMFKDQYPNTSIHVFDSKSASTAQSLIALKIYDLAKTGMNTAQIISTTNNYIDSLNTIFISESLDNLKNNGRLQNIGIKLASLLKLKFVLSADLNGEIELLAYDRSRKKTISTIRKIVEDRLLNSSRKTAAISHVNNPNDALLYKKILISDFGFETVHVTDSQPINTVYCGQNGIIISF